MKEKKVMRITKQDNVVVALESLIQGQTIYVDGTELILQDDIPFGHKIAAADIAQNHNIIKYGQPIGHACSDIKTGSHVHVHNLKTNLEGVVSYEYHRNVKALEKFVDKEHASFQGYKRADGKVGIRNEIWIIPTVGCVNTTAKHLEQAANQKFKDKTDGVFAYTHNMGCSQLNEDHACTQKILKGLIEHPNAAGVLVLSLGCENNNLENFMPVLGDIDKSRVKFLVTQDVEDEYEEGMRLLSELVEQASAYKREKISAEHLVVGFKCGGSDAFSGITANALCGRVNDKLVKCGGSTILTEVPEMFGAETLLMERAVTRQVFENITHLINDFKGYFTKYHQTIYENPSPGNKKGGISTLEDKSLGCTQKAGMAPVVDVLDYGQTVQKNGLNLLTGPGNDQVSCTNLVASGAHMVLFTTGRGNPFGSPVPTVKISSNTPLYEKKKHWIDFNAGKILDGNTMEHVTEEFFTYLLEVASGTCQTQNEKCGYKEISVFRDGVIL